MKLGEKVVPIRLIVPTTLMQSAKHPRMKKQKKPGLLFKEVPQVSKNTKLCPPTVIFVTVYVPFVTCFSGELTRLKNQL